MGRFIYVALHRNSIYLSFDEQELGLFKWTLES
jgi:hypothetical protein